MSGEELGRRPKIYRAAVREVVLLVYNLGRIIFHALALIIIAIGVSVSLLSFVVWLFEHIVIYSILLIEIIRGIFHV